MQTLIKLERKKKCYVPKISVSWRPFAFTRSTSMNPIVISLSLSHSSNLSLVSLSLTLQTSLSFSLKGGDEMKEKLLWFGLYRREKSESQYTSATDNMTKTCVTRRFDKDKATFKGKECETETKKQIKKYSC